jgi:hypothetical protein
MFPTSPLTPSLFSFKRLCGARKLLCLGQADRGLFLHLEILISSPARFALGELLESPEGSRFPKANGVAAIRTRQVLQRLDAARQPMLLDHGHDILDALVPFHGIADVVLYHNMHILITFRLTVGSRAHPVSHGPRIRNHYTPNK